jgi:hypothetical protein
MFKRGDSIITEPYIPAHDGDKEVAAKVAEYQETIKDSTGKIFYRMVVCDHSMYEALDSYEDAEGHNYVKGEDAPSLAGDNAYDIRDLPSRLDFDSILVDYYVERKAGATQMEITADKFGGNYYLEASTLFRSTDGVDMPAEFIIPNCKIQSNFTFTMASSGDPSTFTFTMDAFPDYTRFDRTKKVLAAIQIIEAADTDSAIDRVSTHSTDTIDFNGMVAGARPFAGFEKE